MTKKDHEEIAETLKMWHESQMEKESLFEESYKELVIMLSLTFDSPGRLNTYKFDDYKFAKECGVERKEEDLI